MPASLSCARAQRAPRACTPRATATSELPSVAARGGAPQLVRSPRSRTPLTPARRHMPYVLRARVTFTCVRASPRVNTSVVCTRVRADCPRRPRALHCGLVPRAR
eukprot:6182543-Pleurochrysis_carterae.AAC.1